MSRGHSPCTFVLYYFSLHNHISSTCSRRGVLFLSKKNGKWENRPRVDAEHAPEERLVAPTLRPSLTYLLDLAPGPLGRTYRPQLAIRFRAPDASVRAPLPCSSRAHARLVLEYENSNRVVIAIIDSMPRAIQRVVCAPKAWRRARASTRRDPLGRRHARSSSWSWHLSLIHI